MTRGLGIFRRWTGTLMLALLAGCAGPGLRIDTSVEAVSHNSRVRQVVLHYTSMDAAGSLEVLSRQKVSSHYLITDASRPHIYRLVDEGLAAWHAGDSAWHGQRWLNATSIGIELVNPGWTRGPGGTRVWHPYSAAQIDALIPLLRDVTARHHISPENIVGHSDIAPQRKLDPGPLFPWKTLAQAGLGRWYDEAAAATELVRLQNQPLPDVAWYQRQLQRLGYDCPQSGQLDGATRNVLAAFQMHYRPARYDGQPDAETAAIMLAM